MIIYVTGYEKTNHFDDLLILQDGCGRLLDKRLNAGMFPMTFEPDLLLTVVHVRKFKNITVHVRVCNSVRMCSYIGSYYKSRSSFNCARKVIFESQMSTTVTSHALGSSTTLHNFE